MRKRIIALLGAVILSLALLSSVRAQDSPAASAYPEEAMVEGLLSEWAVQATRQSGPLATWQLQNDATGPGGAPVLALTKANHDNDSTINLLWNRRGGFLNGGLEFRMKAQGGQKARGGGVVWRVRDKNNYYMALADTQASVLNLYSVKEGTLQSLGQRSYDASGQEWITLRIETWGEQIAVGINGRKVIDLKDSTFLRPGGIGYCTRADATTSFTPIRIDY